MKNMQTTNGSFILTSASFKTIKKRDHHNQKTDDTGEVTKRIIKKYDYCLPPEEKDSPVVKKITLPI
jgi:hypothetical protein